MKSSQLTRITLLTILIAAIAVPTIAQRVVVKEYEVAEGSAGTVAAKGVTVSKTGIEVEFTAKRDEGYLTYDYRGLEKIEVGDVIRIHSHRFVPVSAGLSTEERKLEPGDDQWATVTVKSVKKNGNSMKIGLVEPVQVYNSSVRSQGQRGKAPAPRERFTDSLRFVGQSDGSWRMVSRSPNRHGKGAKAAKTDEE